MKIQIKGTVSQIEAVKTIFRLADKCSGTEDECELPLNCFGDCPLLGICAYDKKDRFANVEWEVYSNVKTD